MGSSSLNDVGTSRRLEVEGEFSGQNPFDMSNPSSAKLAEYIEIEERVYDIAKRAVAGLGISTDSFIRAKPLKERGMMTIFYRGEKEGSRSCCSGGTELSVDVKITGDLDIEQLENYRAFKAVVSKARAKTCVLL
jgi:hypothetical protein